MSDFSPPPRKTRRSSILKGSRAPLQNLEDNEGYDEDRTTVTRTTFKRRVSFSSTNNVQEFCNDVDEVWGERYEKPMMHADSKSQTDLVILQSSKSIESLMTGQIKSSVIIAPPKQDIGTPLASQDNDDQEDEMELTSTGMPTFSQESQTLSQAASQVTVIERNALDKENVILAPAHLMDKTIMSTANMSVDGHSLTEDASYLNSPGFNRTHLTVADVDVSDDSDGCMGIFTSAKETAYARTLNKTAHESICMDITTVSRPADEEEEEEKTEDLKASGCNAGFTTTSIFADNTNDILKGDGSESSTDTMDLVAPEEAMCSFSKSRRSLGVSSNSASQMDITNANNASSVSMEMTIAPKNSLSVQMDMTMAPQKSYLSDSPVERLDNNKTVIQPLEMSVDDDPKDADKPPSKSNNLTIYQPVDVSIEDSIGGWNSAVVKNNSTMNLSCNNVTKSITLEGEEDPPQLQPQEWKSPPEAKQAANLSSEEILAKPLTPETSIAIDNMSKTSFLNKTFEVQASRVLSSTTMDCTSVSVPDESLLSDSVFMGITNSTNTENEGRSMAMVSEPTPMVGNKSSVLTQSKQSAYASLKRSYINSVVSEPLPSQHVFLADDQELIISPKRALVVTRSSPEKPNSNETTEADPLKMVRTSPICRNFNAPSTDIIKEMPVNQSLSVADRSGGESQAKKKLQKSRRQPSDHSPVKKMCVARGLDMSASTGKANDCSWKKSSMSISNFDASRRDLDASIRMASDSFMKRNEMDISRRSEFETSKLSISFIRPEMQRKPPLLMASFDEFEKMLASKKNTKLAELSAKMDEILIWHKNRKASMETKNETETQSNGAAAQEEAMEVEAQPADSDDVLSPTAAKLKEMCRNVECYWRFVADDVCGIELSILNNTMTMNFALDSTDAVKKISLTPVKTTFPWQRFVHDLFLKKINVAELNKECNSKNGIPKLLKGLRPKLEKFTQLMMTLESASRRNVLSYQGTRVHFRCFSLKLVIAVEVSVDVSKWDQIDDTDVHVCTFIGNYEFKEIPSLVNCERKNKNFLPKYIKSVEELIATKEKFA